MDKKVNTMSTKLWFLIASKAKTHPWCRGIIGTLEKSSTAAEKWVSHLSQNYSEFSIKQLKGITNQTGRLDIGRFLYNILCLRDVKKSASCCITKEKSFGKTVDARSAHRRLEGISKKICYNNADYQSLHQDRIISSPSGRLIVFLRRMYPNTKLNLIRQIPIRHGRFDISKTVDDITTTIINLNRFTDSAWAKKIEKERFLLSQRWVWYIIIT